VTWGDPIEPQNNAEDLQRTVLELEEPDNNSDCIILYGGLVNNDLIRIWKRSWPNLGY
jgi:hypothetical protein